MTEDEAKTKWCPHVRDATEDLGTYNRWYKWVKEMAVGGMQNKITNVLDDGCTCIGSECMAWRWDLKGAVMEPDHSRGQDDVLFRFENDGRHGFCGLAGRP